MKKLSDEDLKTVAGGMDLVVTGPPLLNIVDALTQPLPTLDQLKEMLKNKQKPA